MIQKKIELRALLEAEQETIAVAMPQLNANDPALATITEGATHAAAGVRPMQVTLSRPASKALQAEVVRRLHEGNYCPPTQLLVAEAVRRAFGRCA